MDKIDLDIVKSFKANNKCGYCSRFLNVEPIYTTYNDEERKLRTFCGRCPRAVEYFVKKNNNPKNRAHIYEKIASSISYPCWNERYGCKAKLNWGEVEKHEEECINREVYCIFTNNFTKQKPCFWSGSVTAFNKHVEEVHKDSILDNPKYEFKDDKRNHIFFIRFKNVLVTVIIKYENETEKYYCLLMVNKTDLESKNFRYKLKFCDKEENNMFALFKNRLEPLYSMEESVKDKKKMLEIGLIKIGELLQNPTNIFIEFEIENIIKIDKNKKTNEAGGDTCLAMAKSVVGSELECPVCSECMASPIFVCNSGHSICNKCKAKLSRCPVCKSVYSNGRNYSLEKVLEKLEPPTLLDENKKRREVMVPCDNKIDGCKFEATIDKMPKHMSDCKYNYIKCPICTYPFLKNDLLNHFSTNHKERIKSINSFETTTMNEQSMYNRNYALFAYDELFKFSIKYNVDKYEFAIHNYDNFDVPNKQPKFWYQLQIRVGPTSNVSLTLNNSCYYFFKYDTFPVYNIISLPKSIANFFTSTPQIKISIHKY